ncbi:MAG: hypothetical protein D6714_05005 [Bacteroidetes bacterium]|nr:MAG: hypothetical protein D6714_05005 [Bacteroidota bacterium]
MKKHLFMCGAILLLLFRAGTSLSAQETFKNAPDEPHIFLIVPGEIVDLKEYRGSVTKYIWRKHARKNLKIRNIAIGKNTKTDMILVEGFPNRAAAVQFYQSLKTDFPDFLHMRMTQYLLPVAQSNYDQIVRQQSLEGYVEFMRNYYPEVKE